MNDHPSVGDVRGIGLLLAIEFVSNRNTKAPFPAEANISNRLSAKFKDHHLILMASQQKITLAPPLCTTREDVDEIILALDSSIGEVESELGVA